jgi:hypothetical protein
MYLMKNNNMKNLLFLVFILIGFTTVAQYPVDTYTVRGRYEVQSDRAFIIGYEKDTLRASTQLDVNDTTIVTLDYVGLNFTKNPADSIQFNREAVTTGHNAYKIDVDTTNGTLRMYNDEVDIAMQMGQELWIKVKNNNGSTLLNGIIVYISGGESGFPVVSIAHDRDFSMVDAIGMLTHDAEAGTFGFLTTYGTVGGLDTSGETEGDRVYVDTLTAGKNWTTEIPEFANFQYEIGFIHTVDPTEGKIFINPKGQVDDIMHNINNANILENFNFTSFSDGSDIFGVLNSSDGKNYLTIRWSDGFAKFSVPDTVIIPSGTDNDSQTGYIYIPKSTGTLTATTSYFPIGTQYKTIARTEAWTALRTQTEGLKGNQNYNDFVASTESLRGRIAQIGNWQRLRNLKYINGSNGTVTVRTASGSPDTVSYAVAQGNWSQSNEQVLDAMDMFTGDDIHALNYPDHTDTTILDLSEILVDATGASLANRSWVFVFWISQNKTGEPSHMYVNLPNGSYSSGAAAEADVLGTKVTEIPYEMRSYSGFVTEVVITHTNPSGGTWVVHSTTNIQGNEPGYAGGGAGDGAGGSFDDLTDTPASKAGSSNKIVGVDLGEANLEYKDVTIDGSGTINIPIGQEYQIDGNNLKLTDLDSTGIGFTQSQIIGLVDTISDHLSRIEQNEIDITTLESSSHPAVTMTGTPDYISIDVGTQVITRNLVDYTTDISNIPSSFPTSSNLQVVTNNGSSTTNPITASLFEPSGSPVSGSLGKTAVKGLIMRGVTGSVYDYAIETPAGVTIFSNLTGTPNFQVNSGTFTVGGLLTADGVTSNSAITINEISNHLKLIETDQANKEWDVAVSGANFFISEIGVDNPLQITAGGAFTLARQVIIEGSTSGDQLRITNSTSIPYKLGRNGATGFLDFQGSQAGFTGYTFKSDDGSNLLNIIDNGNADLAGTLDLTNGLLGGQAMDRDAIEAIAIYTGGEGIDVTSQVVSQDVNSLSTISGGAVVDGDMFLLFDTSLGTYHRLTGGGLKTYIGASTPGGSSGDIQYNNSGSFGGFGDWDGSTLAIEVSSSVFVATFKNPSSSGSGVIISGGDATHAAILVEGYNGADAFFVFGDGDATLNGEMTAESFNQGGITWKSGSGTPEGVITAPIGSIYSRSNGGAGTSFYVKESGVGNTGWVGK